MLSSVNFKTGVLTDKAGDHEWSMTVSRPDCLFFLQTLVLSILSEILSVLLWLFDAFWPKISPYEERWKAGFIQALLCSAVSAQNTTSCRGCFIARRETSEAEAQAETFISALPKEKRNLIWNSDEYWNKTLPTVPARKIKKARNSLGKLYIHGLRLKHAAHRFD